LFHTNGRFEKENGMKNLKWLVLSGLFLSGVVWGTENDSWSAQSTERQFEKTSEVISKTSKDNQKQVLPLTPKVQSKSATSVHLKTAAGAHKKDALAKTFTVRPEAKTINQEFWIFDASVVFFSDDDNDGYYNHFSVELDADTEFSSAEVYARLYLGKDEVFKEYHTTSIFNIFSDNSNDSFVVESELLNGFSSAEYEVLIELYDAYNDELVAVFDGNDDADLYLLSLESKEYESIQVVVVVTEHGGSVSLWGLLLLPILLMTRQYRNLK
jgi:hypothetical protein